MKRLFGDRSEPVPPVPPDPLNLQRLGPTAVLRQRLDQLRVGVEGTAVWIASSQKAHSEIQRLERDLVAAEERDRIQDGRPEGCWCLGAGGRWPRMLYELEAQVLEEYCDCAEGQTRRVLDEQSRAAEQVAAGQRRAEAFLKTSPPHFAELSLDSYPQRTPAQRKVLTAIRKWIEAPEAWLVLHGPYGAGKSALAIGAAAELLRRSDVQSARFAAVPKLLDTLRATYDRDAPQRERDVMVQLEESGLLVLDDLGAERNTDWATERLFVLLNERHDYHRRTIVTSNLPPDELAAHIGERTMWRIAELARGHIVSLVGCPNLRAQLRAVGS